MKFFKARVGSRAENQTEAEEKFHRDRNLIASLNNYTKSGKMFWMKLLNFSHFNVYLMRLKKHKKPFPEKEGEGF